MAFQLHRFCFLNHLVQFFSSDRYQRFRYTLTAAVAVKLGRHGIVDHKVHVSKQFFKNLLRSQALVKECGNGIDFCQTLLQFFNDFLIAERHQLNDKAAGLTDGIVFVHQHTESDAGRNLLTRCKIVGQILCDLTRLQNALSDVRLFQSQVFDDIHESDADSTCHVKFSFFVGRNHDVRVSDVTFYISFGICCYGNAVQRSAGMDAQGQKVSISLHHNAHHCTCRQKAAQRCGCNRARVVILACCLYGFSCCRCKRTNLSVCRCCSYNIIHVSLLFLTFSFFSCYDINTFALRSRRILCECIVGRYKLHACLFQ